MTVLTDRFARAVDYARIVHAESAAAMLSGIAATFRCQARGE